MSSLWYVARGGKKCGPFSAEQLRRFAAAGKIRPTDGVWHEGMKTMVSAAKVKDLFPTPAVQALPAGAPPLVGMVLSSPPQLAAPSPAAAGGPDGLPDLADVHLRPMEPPPGGDRGEIEPTPDDPAATDPLPPGRTGRKDKPADRQAEQPRKRLAVGQKGAIILGQDGVSVHYRKKCTQCGFEDTSRSTMRIGQGVTRDHFYCRKCRKNRDVEIRGSAQ